MTAPDLGTLIDALGGRRGEREATLFVTGRDLPEERELALAWDAPAAGWRLVGDAAARREERHRERVFALLASGPSEGLTPTEVAAALGCPVGSAKTVLWRLNQAGEVERYRGRYRLSAPVATGLQPET